MPNDIRKAKFKKFIEGPVPTLLIVGGASIALVIVYAKFTDHQSELYANYLDQKGELFVKSQNMTLDMVAQALHHDK